MKPGKDREFTMRACRIHCLWNPLDSIPVRNRCVVAECAQRPIRNAACVKNSLVGADGDLARGSDIKWSLSVG